MANITKPCVVDTTVQKPAGVGHNQPPEGIDRKQPPKPQLFGLNAAWLHFANQIELKRLAILHVRIERKKQALMVLQNERKTIMNRCIRRMRRSSGKQ